MNWSKKRCCGDATPIFDDRYRIVGQCQTADAYTSSITFSLAVHMYKIKSGASCAVVTIKKKKIDKAIAKA